MTKKGQFCHLASNQMNGEFHYRLEARWWVNGRMVTLIIYRPMVTGVLEKIINNFKTPGSYSLKFRGSSTCQVGSLEKPFLRYYNIFLQGGQKPRYRRSVKQYEFSKFLFYDIRKGGISPFIIEKEKASRLISLMKQFFISNCIFKFRKIGV